MSNVINLDLKKEHSKKTLYWILRYILANNKDYSKVGDWGDPENLIISLTNSNLAKISRSPGRTRSLIFYELEKKIRLVDFPGYGFSTISQNEKNKLDELIDFYFNNRNTIKKIFLLIDSRLGFKPIDKIFYKNLEDIFSNDLCIIFTKIDKKKTISFENLIPE